MKTKYTFIDLVGYFKDNPEVLRALSERQNNIPQQFPVSSILDGLKVLRNSEGSLRRRSVFVAAINSIPSEPRRISALAEEYLVQLRSIRFNIDLDHIDLDHEWR